MSSTNAAYLDFCDNWLASLKRCGIIDHITIVAEDDTSFYYLKNRTDIDIDVRRPDLTASSGFLLFGTDEYIKMVNRRPTYIQSFLEQGIDVLFCDLDATNEVAVVMHDVVEAHKLKEQSHIKHHEI